MELKYNIGQRVNIEPLKVSGFIMAILIDREGVMYKIRYFDEAEVKAVFFFECELSI